MYVFRNKDVTLQPLSYNEVIIEQKKWEKKHLNAYRRRY